LGHEVHLVLRSSVDLRMAALAAESLDPGGRQSVHADVAEGLLDLVDPMRLHDGGHELHGCLLGSAGAYPCVTADREGGGGASRTAGSIRSCPIAATPPAAPDNRLRYTSRPSSRTMNPWEAWVELEAVAWRASRSDLACALSGPTFRRNASAAANSRPKRTTCRIRSIAITRRTIASRSASPRRGSSMSA